MAEKKTTTNKNAEALLSKVVRVELSNKRRVTAKTKKRGEVSGGGKKPFRQKGTGRARAGSNRSPIWRGGGIVFGPTGNENYSLQVNKKEKASARKEAYEAKKDNTITVQAAKITKTKEASELLKKNNASGKVLVLATGLELKRFFRNIAGLKFKLQGTESVYDILRADKIVKISGAASKEEK